MMNKKGFTLIELLIIIVIIGILVGVAGVAGRSALDRTNVERFIATMNADFMNAQISSMQRSRFHFILLAANPPTYTIFEDTDGGPNGDEILTPALDRRIKQVAESPRYALTIVPPLAGGQIFFNRRGFVGGGLVGSVTIRVTQGFGSPLDCIVITPTRTRAGVWNVGGGTCVEQ